MFTDTVGYTASTQIDEARTLDLLRQQADIIRPLVSAHHGREIKSTGDGFLVEFDSALKATQCAVDIQRRIYERNAEGVLASIQIRIGVHLGDVVQTGSDIFGDAVNIAARIEPIAEPGGVCVSGAVREQVWNKIPDRLEKLPAAALKGVQLPIEIYRVVLPWNARGSSSPSPTPSGLAILPFANISPDPKDEYFADGLTEEMITVLSQVRELRVIARTSVMQYKATTKAVSQIGSELGVSSILEGSVRRAGNRLRITAQLIDVGSQGHVWAASYDRELDDVFAIQTEIAEKTAGALRLELLGPQRNSIRKKPTSNLAAYDLYLKGIHAARQSGERIAEAIKLFEEALRMDPEFSLAYASLANVYILLSGETLPNREAFPRAKELVAKALDLDPNLSDAHTARGNLALQEEHDWVLAETEFRKAISLNPSNANAHFWYAGVLRVVRRFGEAIEELTTTIELDPLWELPRFWLMYNYALAGDLSAAIAAVEEARGTDPQAPMPHLSLGFIYVNAGRMDDARKEADLIADPVPKSLREGRAILKALLGNPEEARRLAAEREDASRTEYVSPDEIASLYAAVGETEKALDWLERGEQSGEGGLWAHYQDPTLAAIREEPRFKALLKKLNLT
jgi:adenylate cyclase